MEIRQLFVVRSLLLVMQWLSIVPLLHIHLLMWAVGPVQSAYYYILGFTFGGFSQLALGWLQSKEVKH
jgi:hypothetical protein